MTTYLMPEEVKEVRVGDAGVMITFAVIKTNRREAQDLTGYGAIVSFWTNSGTEPHVRRFATVSGATGLVQYLTQGDEFATVGPCFAQATIATPDWYLGNAPGRGGHEFSTDILQFIVLPRPS